MGHKGLFFERLEAPLVRVPDNAPDPFGTISTPTPQLEPNARGLYYVRNRWLDPQRGRWLTSDPNATGQTVVGLAIGGTAFEAALLSPSISELCRDGSNLYQHVRGDPILGADPLGLEFSMGSLLGRMGIHTSIMPTAMRTILPHVRRGAANGAMVGGGVGFASGLTDANATGTSVLKRTVMGMVAGSLTGGASGGVGHLASQGALSSGSVWAGMGASGAFGPTVSGIIDGKPWHDVVLDAISGAAGGMIAGGAGYADATARNRGQVPPEAWDMITKIFSPTGATATPELVDLWRRGIRDHW